MVVADGQMFARLAQRRINFARFKNVPLTRVLQTDANEPRSRCPSRIGRSAIYFRRRTRKRIDLTSFGLVTNGL